MSLAASTSWFFPKAYWYCRPDRYGIDPARRPAIFGGFRTSAAVRREAARFTADLKPSHTMAAVDALKRWDKPVLMAWGTSDKLFPLSHAHRLAETFPDAVVRTIEDSSTYVMLDRPDEAAEAIREFLAEGRSRSDG